MVEREPGHSPKATGNCKRRRAARSPPVVYFSAGLQAKSLVYTLAQIVLYMPTRRTGGLTLSRLWGSPIGQCSDGFLHDNKTLACPLGAAIIWRIAKFRTSARRRHWRALAKAVFGEMHVRPPRYCQGNQIWETMLAEHVRSVREQCPGSRLWIKLRLTQQANRRRSLSIVSQMTSGVSGRASTQLLDACRRSCAMLVDGSYFTAARTKPRLDGPDTTLFESSLRSAPRRVAGVKSTEGTPQ
jgi:hypothetical protein